MVGLSFYSNYIAAQQSYYFQNKEEGTSFAVALPPSTNGNATEFIMQASGPLSYGFAGLSTGQDLSG